MKNIGATPERLARGEHSFEIADCAGCHPERDLSRWSGPELPGRRGGKLVADMRLAGGREFVVGAFSVRTANITPEMEAGIGAWNEGRFIEKFRGYARMTTEGLPKASQENFTLMPWTNFTRLTDAELQR